jgi:hypothetical protein
MLTNQIVTAAYHRLLAYLGDADEQTAIARNEPTQLPSEAELMGRAVRQAVEDPAAGTANLRAALELAGRDQYFAEGRERNVITMLRERGVPWREIAYHRGLKSAQAAQQRYEKLAHNETPEVVIYAFREAGRADAPWHGDPDALPDGQFRTGLLEFNPAMPRPFSGCTLELRYGSAAADIMPAYLRAYAQVDGRRIAPTAAVQEELFGG